MHALLALLLLLPIPSLPSTDVRIHVLEQAQYDGSFSRALAARGWPDVAFAFASFETAATLRPLPTSHLELRYAAADEAGLRAARELARSLASSGLPEALASAVQAAPPQVRAVPALLLPDTCDVQLIYCASVPFEPAPAPSDPEVAFDQIALEVHADADFGKRLRAGLQTDPELARVEWQDGDRSANSLYALELQYAQNDTRALAAALAVQRRLTDPEVDDDLRTPLRFHHPYVRPVPELRAGTAKGRALVRCVYRFPQEERAPLTGISLQFCSPPGRADKFFASLGTWPLLSELHIGSRIRVQTEGHTPEPSHALELRYLQGSDAGLHAAHTVARYLRELFGTPDRSVRAGLRRNRPHVLGVPPWKLMERFRGETPLVMIFARSNEG